MVMLCVPPAETSSKVTDRAMSSPGTRRIIVDDGRSWWSCDPPLQAYISAIHESRISVVLFCFLLGFVLQLIVHVILVLSSSRSFRTWPVWSTRQLYLLSRLIHVGLG
jgi:hypothetical protein